MTRTIRNSQKQAVTVAVKLESGKLDSIVIPARSEVTLEESSFTPDLLIKAQRGKIEIL